MPVTLTDSAAAIAAITIDAYLEEHRNNHRYFSELAAVLGTPEPQPLADRTISALEIVLDQLRRPDKPPRVPIATRTIPELLRAVRTPRTLTELALEFDAAPEQIHETLLGLEELGHVEQLMDGHHVVRWEITEAGEQTL